MATNHEATIYQITQSGYPSAVSPPSSLSATLIPDTFECQIVFPNIDNKKDLITWDMPDLSSSLFGVHSVASTGSNMTWNATDKYNYQVYAIRDSYGSKGVRFALKTNGFGLSTTLLTSSYYPDVYDNTQWNFAVRIKPKLEDYSYPASSSVTPSNYILEFYGVNVIADIIQSEFLLTASLATADAQSALSTYGDKRFYIGAHRTNYTGSVLTKSDIRVVSSRYWLKYLDNSTVKAHAKNFKNYSGGDSTKLSYVGLYSDVSALDTLVFNWDFSNVTSSNSSGRFFVNDNKLSSTKNNNFSSITNKYYYGIGDFFPNSSSGMVEYDYLTISKSKLPEQLSVSDTVQIIPRDDITFTKDSRPIENILSIENSMYSIISDEMMNMFSNSTEFNNLIASPLNLYKKNYKELEYFRTLFFNKVNNTPNFEKYIELFKWIDNSINVILKQIIPANFNISEDISTVLESHILERNKHPRSLPIFQDARKIGFFPIKARAELDYSWPSGSAPLGNATGSSGLWLKERAERTSPYVTSNNSSVDTIRQKLLNAINNINKQTSYKLIGNSQTYSFDNYFLTKGAIPYKINCEFLNGNRPDSVDQLKRNVSGDNLFTKEGIPQNNVTNKNNG